MSVCNIALCEKQSILLQPSDDTLGIVVQPQEGQPPARFAEICSNLNWDARGKGPHNRTKVWRKGRIQMVPERGHAALPLHTRRWRV